VCQHAFDSTMTDCNDSLLTIEKRKNNYYAFISSNPDQFILFAESPLNHLQWYNYYTDSLGLYIGLFEDSYLLRTLTIRRGDSLSESFYFNRCMNITSHSTGINPNMDPSLQYRSGVTKFYYDNGSIERIVVNSYDGVFISENSFFPNGSISEMSTALKDGVVQNISYHENGNIRCIYYMKNGLNNGIQTTFDKDGNLLKSILWENGLLIKTD
jgi:hypothetical protein